MKKRLFVSICIFGAFGWAFALFYAFLLPVPAIIKAINLCLFTFWTVYIYELFKHTKLECGKCG